MEEEGREGGRRMIDRRPSSSPRLSPLLTESSRAQVQPPGSAPPHRPCLARPARREPGRGARRPPEHRPRNVHDARPRHRRRRRVGQVLHLENELHGGGHGHAFAVGQGEHLQEKRKGRGWAARPPPALSSTTFSPLSLPCCRPAQYSGSRSRWRRRGRRARSRCAARARARRAATARQTRRPSSHRWRRPCGQTFAVR